MNAAEPGDGLKWNTAALRIVVFVICALMGGVLAGLIPVESPVGRSVLFTFAAGALANAISVRLFEHAQFKDFGMEWNAAAGRDLLLGLGYGAAAAASVVAGMLLFNWARFEPAPADPAPVAAGLSALLLFGAAGEEMMYHGYAFQVLLRYLGAFAAILPVAILFALMHLGNPSSNVLALVNTAIWGVVLGYARYRSGMLWLPIGIHFGWNVALPLTGANLSGITMRIIGYELHQQAGSWLSGGAYGPEGSVLATAAAAVLFWKIAQGSREGD